MNLSHLTDKVLLADTKRLAGKESGKTRFQVLVIVSFYQRYLRVNPIFSAAHFGEFRAVSKGSSQFVVNFLKSYGLETFMLTNSPAFTVRVSIRLCFFQVIINL